MKNYEEEILEIAREALKTEADAVSALSYRLDRSFEKLIDTIIKSRGRIVVIGMGKSGLVGRKIAATLSSTGTPAFFVHPAEAVHGDLGMITSDDIILTISNSGETDEIVKLIPFLKRFNVTILSMTGKADSTLANVANINLDISVEKEACPMGIVPTASTTAALAMGDAIAVALLVKRGFREENFASFHPEGSLGRKLFIKVKDLMHTGENVPLVSFDTTVTDAIIEISSKRLGITVVLDREYKIAGIVTDGDLRRGIERWGKAFFDMKAEEVMTVSPKTISDEELAARALAIMESYTITSILVPDEKGGIKGIIHIHDILKKGIV